MKKQLFNFMWIACEHGKRWLDKLQQRFSTNHHNPWRCEVCGSKNVSYRAWIEGNTEEVLSEADDRDDLWCGYCREHTYQIRETDLMREAIEPWWRDGATEEVREAVTGFCRDDFSPEENNKAFRDTCNAWWNRKCADEKIRIWRKATCAEE